MTGTLPAWDFPARGGSRRAARRDGRSRYASFTFEDIDREALEAGLADSFFSDCLRRRDEVICGNIFGDAGSSFSYNLTTGLFNDFADPDIHGKGYIKFLSLKDGIDYHKAFKKTVDILHPIGPAEVLAAASRAGHCRRPALLSADEEFRVVAPPPGYVPDVGEMILTDRKTGTRRPPADVAGYQVEEFGWREAFWVCRYLPVEPGGRKELRPFTFGIRKGERWPRLHWKAPPEGFVRPLLGLFGLRFAEWQGMHDIPVLVVEGEKCWKRAGRPENCLALRELLFGGRHFLPVTWSGGAGAVGRTSWEPLAGHDEIWLWPDNDDAGRAAADRITRILEVLDGTERALTVKTVLFEGRKPGYDVADFLDEFGQGGGRSRQEGGA